ncbi:hypothetical protein AAFN60_01215 [Roseibacillus persicicus]|uniref:hypothetical protein n=1 Tax=Roseibacillus persicicus TaxID=454148 RepID=UPI00398AF843
MIQSTCLACVALLFASCASDPYYSNNGYGGGGYPNQSGGIDVPKTTALVAAGIAGLSLYHYAQEKDKRKKAERAHASHHRSPYRDRGYDDHYGRRGYDRRDSYRRY